MKNAILHISDLHVTRHLLSNKSPNPRVNSYLTTHPDHANANHFLDTFLDEVKRHYPNSDYSLTLLISGDISDIGDPIEFEFAENFISKIMRELKIAENSCLLLPGDHDVHRRSMENAIENNPGIDQNTLNEIKFKNFGLLYSKIKKTDFPYNDIIIDHIMIGDSIVLIGINSNYNIDSEGGEGFIPIEKFLAEIEALKKKLNNPNLHYITCWHHNLTANYDDKERGQWDFENRRMLLPHLEKHNIKLILTGNEHISGTDSVSSATFSTSDCGTFTAQKYDATFKIYPVILDGNIKLDNKIFGLAKPNGNEVAFFWSERDSQSAKQLREFEIFIKNDQAIPDVLELPEEEVESEGTQAQGVLPTQNENSRIYYNNEDIADKLYLLIREKKVFHSGHFHWSDTSRAHNWIDVSKLVEENENLYFVQNAIIDVINTFTLAQNCDLMIGLGYEGNIISSKASIKFDIPYTSLPYSYRYGDHHDYEKKLNFNNDTGKYKTVLIITDVVNDGRTIRKLIDKREPDFFKNVVRIIVVSLFYTGHQTIHTDILNYDNLPDDYDLENDHKVNNIEFYTVKSLRVEKCPYGNDYKEQCFIYKDELSCVHLFYDAN